MHRVRQTIRLPALFLQKKMTDPPINPPSGKLESCEQNPPEGNKTAFCVKCRQKREVPCATATFFESTRGNPMMKAHCPVCNSKVMVFLPKNGGAKKKSKGIKKKRVAKDAAPAPHAAPAA